MAAFGTVDFVIADIDARLNKVLEFISVEVQAVDLTGSVEPAYNAIINNVAVMTDAPDYGVNWANVRKRYISQLITKGFYHHHWKTRIVSIIQTQLYKDIRKAIQFDDTSVSDPATNIVFMLYDFEPAPDKGLRGAHRLTLEKVVGTTHENLMVAAMGNSPPPKHVFCGKILDRLL